MSRAGGWIFGTLIGLGAGFYIGWEAGHFVTVQRLHNQQYERDAALVYPLLSGDPAFHRLGPLNYPVGGFCLVGTVPTQADHDRLRAELVRLLGEPRMAHVLNDVTVEGAKEPG
jgi:hypothetical protein